MKQLTTLLILITLFLAGCVQVGARDDLTLTAFRSGEDTVATLCNDKEIIEVNIIFQNPNDEIIFSEKRLAAGCHKFTASTPDPVACLADGYYPGLIFPTYWVIPCTAE